MRDRLIECEDCVSWRVGLRQTILNGYCGWMAGEPTFKDFDALGLRVGIVLRAEPNDGARDAAYKLWIDLGRGEPVQSSAKITDRYRPDDLIGRQVVVVTGFSSMRIGGFRSDVLVLGALTDEGVVLLEPDTDVPPGSPVA